MAIVWLGGRASKEVLAQHLQQVVPSCVSSCAGAGAAGSKVHREHQEPTEGVQSVAQVCTVLLTLHASDCIRLHQTASDCKQQTACSRLLATDCLHQTACIRLGQPAWRRGTWPSRTASCGTWPSQPAATTSPCLWPHARAAKSPLQHVQAAGQRRPAGWERPPGQPRQRS